MEYPRRSRLGLIEAGPTTTRLAAKPCIRGVRASASLKPFDNLSYINDEISEYPRRSRLGLIEASDALRMGSAYGPVSEAFAPRPH